MKRFTITLSITLLFFTSFAISLYGMKAGESGAAAPAAPPSAAAAAPEAGVSAEAGEEKDFDWDGLINMGSKRPSFDDYIEHLLNYLFFESPYHSGSIRGVRSSSASDRHKRFYCPNDTIDTHSLKTFLQDKENFPCRFWVHNSQSAVEVQLAERFHRTFPQRETLMFVHIGELINRDLKESASCRTMRWDELDTFVKYSVAGLAPGEKTEDQKIFILDLARSIPRERIHFYSAGSGENVSTCLAITHEERYISLHFLPTRREYCDEKTLHALIQYAIRQTKTSDNSLTILLVRDDFYDFFTGMGFHIFAYNGHDNSKAKNGFIIHYMTK